MRERGERKEKKGNIKRDYEKEKWREGTRRELGERQSNPTPLRQYGKERRGK